MQARHHNSDIVPSPRQTRPHGTRGSPGQPSPCPSCSDPRCQAPGRGRRGRSGASSSGCTPAADQEMICSGVDRRYCHHLVVGTVYGGGGLQGAVAGGAGEASPVVVPTIYTQPLSLVHCKHRSEGIRQTLSIMRTRI